MSGKLSPSTSRLRARLTGASVATASTLAFGTFLSGEARSARFVSTTRGRFSVPFSFSVSPTSCFSFLNAFTEVVTGGAPSAAGSSTGGAKSLDQGN